MAQDPNSNIALTKRLIDDSWLTVDEATGNGYARPRTWQLKQARIARMDEALVEIDPMQILDLPFEITANNDYVQPQPHTQVCAARADIALAENDLKQLLDLPFEMDAFDDLQPHAAASNGTFFADDGSFITTGASIGLHNSTAFADGYQGDVYSSITTFGTGRGTGIQPEPSQIEISGNQGCYLIFDYLTI